MSFIPLIAIKKSDLLTELRLQARDIRFSALTTLLVRRARIILRLQVTHHCVCHYWDHSVIMFLYKTVVLSHLSAYIPGI